MIERRIIEGEVIVAIWDLATISSRNSFTYPIASERLKQQKQVWFTQETRIAWLKIELLTIMNLKTQIVHILFTLPSIVDIHY